MNLSIKEPTAVSFNFWRAALLMLVVSLLISSSAIAEEEPGTKTEAKATNPLDSKRAYAYLNQVCDFGPRPSGSRAMKRQQGFLLKHFKKLGAEASLQPFKYPHPLSGKKVRMANLIARWNPDAKERILLCAHYDTRPLPDRDPNPALRTRGRFIGANDGGSGVAVLMEIAHLLSTYEGEMGIDIVLFDAEELVYRQQDPYFLGSQRFAYQYLKRKGDWSYRWGILLDMVGDADLKISWEQNSHSWPETRPLNESLWAVAKELGVKEFVPRLQPEILDDHLALRNIGRIPTIDIIDFEYPAWHTTADVPHNCSGDSLAKVGWVVWEWLLREEPSND